MNAAAGRWIMLNAAWTELRLLSRSALAGMRYGVKILSLLSPQVRLGTLDKLA
jgi:hypothetical protein